MLLRLLMGLFCLMLTQVVCGQEKYAFVVGVENYDPEFFRNLDFAEEDAVALAAQLENMDYSVTLMTSQQRNPQQKPTSPKKILRLLDGVLQSVGAKDTVVISLSGHGIQFTDEQELPGGGKETYFVPEEGKLTEKESLLPIVDNIVSRMDACPADRKLLLIDACRNEVLSPAADKSSGKINLGSIHENARVVPKGMTVLFSCSSGQKSWETNELKHSVFSNFVLEYLSGKLSEDLYTDRNADVSGLVDFVRRKTNQYVVRNISPDGQYPKLIGETEPWPIGKVGPRAAITNSLGIQLKLIPAGKFTMGSPVGEVNRGADERQHLVEITQPFYLGVHEITRGQYRQFVDQTHRGSRGIAYGYNENPNRITADPRFSFEDPGFEQSDDHPVVCVSWLDATEFCKWLSRKESRTYRLPTEAEWEYACRAGTVTTYSFGNRDIQEYANVSSETRWLALDDDEDGFKFSAPVGSFKANPFGLFDMHGNVNEWCSDFYGSDYFGKSPGQDPTGPVDGDRRILKGGSFQVTAKSGRAATRLAFSSDQRMLVIGFRVALEID